MVLKIPEKESIPSTPFKLNEQIEYRVNGRILHTSARGPFQELVAAIPATIGEFIKKLAQQGRWGQIVVFQQSAHISAEGLEKFGAYLKNRYQNPAETPVTALVFGPEVEGGSATAPLFLRCYQEAGIESHVFEEYAPARDWVEARIHQFSARLEWRKDYCIGDASIDEQHHELFKRAAYVIAATSHEGQVMSAIRLFQYMRTHISHEEELMRHVNYPYIDTHIKLHQELIAKLTALSTQIANENLVKTELEDFISEWFVKHMETADRQLADFMATLRKS